MNNSINQPDSVLLPKIPFEKMVQDVQIGWACRRGTGPWRTRLQFCSYLLYFREELNIRDRQRNKEKKENMCLLSCCRNWS